MKSNIIFTSNIYPLKSQSIYSDKEFLSKVWDYKRLYGIRQRNSSCEFPPHQDKILMEQPTCALNPEDPCWGMIENENGYQWVCRCTKSKCKLFNQCRSAIPYDKEKEAFFRPKKITTDEYGYEHFLRKYYEKELLVTNDNTEMPSKELENLKDEKQEDLENIELEKIVIDKVPEDTVIKEEKPVKISIASLSEKEEENNAIVEDLSKEETSKNLVNREYDACEDTTGFFSDFKKIDQETIIEAESDNKMFVDAGPGTGKTYTVLKKLEYMVSELEVDPESIVVLCFTNAATNEIRDRLNKRIRKGADRGLANIDIRTFHSFAWWLISEANELFSDEGWKPIQMQELDFEKSLICATNVVKRFSEEVFSGWSHLVIDEVQDITDNLAEFVLAIIKSCIENDCGVTALGDSCQAIYDYNAMTMNSTQFYKELKNILGDDTEYYFLTENHRQSDSLINLTKNLREAILSGDTEEMCKETKALSKVLKEDNDFQPEKYDDGSLCVLMRNNGQTLQYSSNFRKQNIMHKLNITECNDNYAPWIADMFQNFEKKSIRKEDFMNCDFLEDGEKVWKRLNDIMHKDNDVLDVDELLDYIAYSRIDDQVLRENDNSNLIVSNIHRAKGREYDAVCIDSEFIKTLAKEPADEGEYKVLYVALTRPKEKIFVKSLYTGRLTVREVFATHRKRWESAPKNKIKYYEFKPNQDLDPYIFANTPKEFFDDIKIGDALFFKKKTANSKVYKIVHEETENILGEISGSYVEDLIYRMKIDTDNYVDLPETIDNLYVSEIYSKVLDREYLNENKEIQKNNPSGVWKWIDIVGLGHASYDVY